MHVKTKELPSHSNGDKSREQQVRTILKMINLIWSAMTYYWICRTRCPESDKPTKKIIEFCMINSRIRSSYLAAALLSKTVAKATNWNPTRVLTSYRPPSTRKWWTCSSNRMAPFNDFSTRYRRRPGKKMWFISGIWTKIRMKPSPAFSTRSTKYYFSGIWTKQ